MTGELDAIAVAVEDVGREVGGEDPLLPTVRVLMNELLEAAERLRSGLAELGHDAKVVQPDEQLLLGL